MRGRTKLPSGRPISFPYRVSLFGVRDRKPRRTLEPGWCRFRFLNLCPVIEEQALPERTVSVLCTNLAFPDDAEVQLDIKSDTLMSLTSTILLRKVFRVPIFIDRPSVLAPPIGAAADILRMAAKNSNLRECADQFEAMRFFQDITQLILIYWPNSETAELELARTMRPPQALRQALAYILSRNGIVETAALVADNSGTGLRTLEKLFAQSFGIGIARYAKMLRLRSAALQCEQTNLDLASLAKVYRFSNLSRFKLELESLDLVAANELEPENFYRRLLGGTEPHDRIKGPIAQAYHAKGTVNG